MEMNKLSDQNLYQMVQKALPGFSVSEEPVLLGGGNLNHVWRLKSDEQSVIVKHAPPFIASQPEVALSSQRIHFEAAALRLFSEGGFLGNLVSDEIRPPHIHYFDPDEHILVMEDVGDFESIESLSGSDLSAEKAGKKLGMFIGQFHAKTYKNEGLKKDFNNEDIQHTRAEVQYRGAENHIDAAEVDVSVKEEAAKKCRILGEQLLKPGSCLIMGDLWPPSLMADKKQRLRLIDWEFVHFGRPLQDVAHFAVHCVMQSLTAENPDRTNWWKELFKAFWNGYKEGASELFHRLIDSKEIADMQIHAGAEMLVRLNGPFRNGYVYEEVSDQQPVWQESMKLAIGLITKSESIFELCDGSS